MVVTDGRPRPVEYRHVASLEELLGSVTEREPMKTTDSKSGADFERVVRDGQRYVVKYLHSSADWITRATGDYGPRVLVAWGSGLLDALPGEIDHAIVGLAHDPVTRRTALLMRDVAAELVPEGSSLLPLAQHLTFLDHMAALHAAWFDRTDIPDLTPMPTRYTALTPLTTEVEHQFGWHSTVADMLPGLWASLDAASPEAAAVARALGAEPWPLVAALEQTPATFVHGDWKAGNLGTTGDGRTILLDWQWPGRAAPCVDLAWYLAVNCDRLPQSKEDAIAAYRAALDRRGVRTEGWFDRQLELALLGAFVQLGWSKTHDPRELSWWAERAVPAAWTLR